MNQPEYRKTYVTINLKVFPDGRKRPMSLVWKDGVTYEIDRLLHITPAASLKVGGRGTRYTVMIEGKERYLFEDDGRWFVEERISSS